ncbi:hypothetical protein SDC9_05982 [bioreactor metagenome]|uniref:Phosphoglycolate phosphatase n=1 Tax=bioreactor metagenome TaxID=1076179 RepID=A0A644T3B5_9ZZZZ|nr:YqeG family HAD IIIA-type phosphatase [Negativicutes bacterium]
MYNLLCPNLVVKSLSDINIGDIKERKIRGFIFDLDNTIISWDSPTMQPEIIDWIHYLINEGYKVCLLSNNMAARVSDIASKFDIPFVSRAYKPAKAGFRRAANLMKLNSNEIAVVGDQLFTDVLGGNRLGMYTIWVSPLSSREFIGTKITRKLEKITVRILKAKGLIK